MSTTDLDQPTASAPTPADPDLKTYRGKTLEELLPKIREELGPDALVVRQRDGLMGGIGGFFQQQFVEVDAKAGHPRIDVYDEPPAAAPPVPPVPAPDVMGGFAGLLAAAAVEAEVAPDPVVEPPAPPKAAPPKPAASAKPRRARAKAAPKRKPTAAKPSDGIAAELAAHGLGEQLAAQLAADALAHELPFAPDADPRTAVRRALARRIPLALPRRGRGCAVAFVGAGGAGKTRAAAGLASAYAHAGQVPVVVLALASDDGGAALRRLLAPVGLDVEAVATTAAARARIEQAPSDALVVLDTPAVSPGDKAGIMALAAQLTPLGLDELQLVVPATIGAAAAQELHERLAPLKPSAIALSHADATDRVGAVVELACATRLPLSYVVARESFAPVDPHALAERLLP